MADRLELYEVTVPAGTIPASPLVTALAFDPGYLRRWQVVIPDGAAGQVGFRFHYAGQQLVPNTRNTWITGNDERLEDDVTYEFVGAQWTIVAYNAGLFQHLLRIRLYVDEIGSQAPAVSAVPTVLPVTINAGTLDLTPDTAPVPIFAGDVATFVPADLTPLDLTGDTVASDLPAPPADTTTSPDAPAVADIPADVTDTTEATP